jgi:hypothetical protein
MDQLRRLRFVTERYEHLQGLRLVPLGIPFLISSAWRDGELAWVPWTHGNGARLWFLALLGVAFSVSVRLRGYYQRHFGDVQAVGSLSGPLATIVFLALFLLAASLPDSPVSMPAIIVALGLAYVGLAGEERRLHYLVVALFVAIFACLGALGVPGPDREVLFDELAGVGLIVIGAGDHALLRRTLVGVSHVTAV